MVYLFLIFAAIVFCWSYFYNDDEPFVAVMFSIFVSCLIVLCIMATLLFVGILLLLF